MNIYHVYRVPVYEHRLSPRYNEYSAFIAVARSEDEARHLTPCVGRELDDEYKRSADGSWPYGAAWPVDPNELVVVLLGEASPGIESGTIVLSSFDAA